MYVKDITYRVAFLISNSKLLTFVLNNVIEYRYVSFSFDEVYDDNYI